MCDIISWMEVERDGKIKIFHLDDKDVFSSRGREIFKDYRDNDVWGHGAIGKYFGLQPKQGTEKEQKDFWELETLPQEIAEKLKTPEDFIKNFGKMFKEHSQNDDLVYILKHAPKPYRDMVWGEMTRRGASASDALVDTITCDIYFEPYQKMAWEELLKYKPSARDLYRIVKWGPKPYNKMAWDKIKKIIPDSDNNLIQFLRDTSKTNKDRKKIRNLLMRKVIEASLRRVGGLLTLRG